MDGKRIQAYWSNEMQALLDTYTQFETLLPATKKQGASHAGEDGRYVETLIREYLKKYLPKDLEVLTGFIVRPAVKTGLNSKKRKSEKDQHSTQLDIIVYDTASYPVFQRFGDSVIVPPEGVIAIISVKKNLHETDICSETQALKRTAKLCKCFDNSDNEIRSPFLALVSMDSFEKKRTNIGNWIFGKLQETYSTQDTFDELVGYIGAIKKWSIFKPRPKKDKSKAEYIFFQHQQEETHLGFQFLLTGILSVFYDPTRNRVSRPGFTSFPSNRQCDIKLGSIELTSDH